MRGLSFRVVVDPSMPTEYVAVSQNIDEVEGVERYAEAAGARANDLRLEGHTVELQMLDPDAVIVNEARWIVLWRIQP